MSTSHLHFFNFDIVVELEQPAPPVNVQIIAPSYTEDGDVYIGEFGEIQEFRLHDQEVEALIEVKGEKTDRVVWVNPSTLVILPNEFPSWQDFYW